MPRQAAKKTKQAKQQTNYRGRGRPRLTDRSGAKKKNKVEVLDGEKKPKFGYEPVGKLSASETRIINLFRSQVGTKGAKPIDRAAKLAVGETAVFNDYSLHGFANSVKRLEKDEGMEFNYHEGLLALGNGLPSENVLWIKRVK